MKPTLLPLLGLLAAAPLLAQPADRIAVAERVAALTRDSRWTLAETIPITFVTHHPQGMVRIGDTLVVSSVEITRRTTRYPQPVDGYDRDTGAGAGHLFTIDLSSRNRGGLIADLRLGEGAIYHPGGIDFDGRHLWVPVAEYRPDSAAIVYRIDPKTMTPEPMLRFADHIGAVVRNTDDDTLHGVSWGSRRFYRWTLDKDGRVTNRDVAPAALRTLNPSHYVDYQDCKYAGRRMMLCGGVSELRPPGAPAFRLGGLDLIDLTDGRPRHQVPVPLWTAGGLGMTHNPVWIEPTARGLRAYFMPEDDTSTVYVYEVEGAGARRP
jgi:Family of unknown function (DUF6454)